MVSIFLNFSGNSLYTSSSIQKYFFSPRIWNLSRSITQLELAIISFPARSFSLAFYMCTGRLSHSSAASLVASLNDLTGSRRLQGHRDTPVLLEFQDVIVERVFFLHSSNSFGSLSSWEEDIILGSFYRSLKPYKRL